MYPRISETKMQDLLNDLDEARDAIMALAAICGSDEKRKWAREDLRDIAAKFITVASTTSS